MNLKKWITVFLLVPLLTACSSEDSVDGIFLNKIWRLSTIMQNTHSSIYDYNSEEQKTISDSAQGCFAISFLPNSQFTVNTLKNTYNGKWEVDGKKHTISFTFTNLSSDPSDAVSKRMIEIMRNAVKYSGDSKTLTIEQQSGAYLLLYPLN